MARKKKAQKKEEATTLVHHRTHSAAAVRAFLDAGGSARAVVSMLTRTEEMHTLMLHVMAQLNPHPHKIKECVRLLVAAGADINAFNKIANGTVQTALMCAAQTCCCPKVSEILLENGAEPKESADQLYI
jgi:hypothetical protein